ncbi:MAG: 4a-hydroxytetrahydrobiopterin dehydratase [Acidimicrobiales bacterium]
MADSITPQQFRESPGVDEWRVHVSSATAHFKTLSFARGVELVNAIAVLAEMANHHPDVDLRYSEVTVGLTSHDIQGLSQRDVALAKQISTAAHDLGILAERE